MVRRAVLEGPQIVTQKGKEAGVVLSAEEYRKIIKPQTSRVEFFRNSPLVGIELDWERDKDTGREAEF